MLSGYRIKGSGIILTYFMMAMTVPIQLFLFPLYYAFAKLNLIGNIPATSLILSAMFMPLSVFLMRTFFLNVPKELEDAARIDGANTGQVIWHVMRPVVSPGLITVGILIGLQSWNEYLVSSTFLQGEKNFTATDVYKRQALQYAIMSAHWGWSRMWRWYTVWIMRSFFPCWWKLCVTVNKRHE